MCCIIPSSLGKYRCSFKRHQKEFLTTLPGRIFNIYQVPNHKSHLLVIYIIFRLPHVFPSPTSPLPFYSRSLSPSPSPFSFFSFAFCLSFSSSPLHKKFLFYLPLFICSPFSFQKYPLLAIMSNFGMAPTDDGLTPKIGRTRNLDAKTFILGKGALWEKNC